MSLRYKVVYNSNDNGSLCMGLGVVIANLVLCLSISQFTQSAIDIVSRLFL